MRRVGAERLVVCGTSVGAEVGHVAEHVVGCAAVFGEVPIEIAGASLGLVVYGKVPYRLRANRKPAFGETRSAAVEVVDGAGDGCAGGPAEFAVLVGDFVHGDGFAAFLVAVEVAAEPGVGVVRGLCADGVALGEVGVVLKLETVAFAVNVAAPVAVVALVVAPVVGVAVFVQVPCVVNLELSPAVVCEVPAHALSEGESVARAEVGVGGAAERCAFAPAFVPDVVNVAGEEVAAPPGRVAGHDAQAVVGVEGVVPVGHP